MYEQNLPEGEYYDSSSKTVKHSKCRGYYNELEVFVCGYGTRILCSDCKYGSGNIDPMRRSK